MVETHRIWIIRQPGTPRPAWCARCARTVRMITADEAARLVRQSTRTIYAWVEADRLHYRETPAGSLLVCLDSLLAGEADADAARRVPEILASLDGVGVRDYEAGDLGFYLNGEVSNASSE